jgi:uncharacterized protein (DUF2236 family)
MRLNPLGALLDKGLDDLRPDFFKGMRFDAPAGDAGWFGPGSAVWHVHGHYAAMFLGLGAAALIETLHPDFAWAGFQHSRAAERVDGEATGQFDLDGLRIRAAHSAAFFTGVAYGPTDTAERATRAVRAMHRRVHGVRPDGRSYDADEPEMFRWAYATVVWGIATAHERYHVTPLTDIDEYYGEFVRVGEALGGSDLPATKQAVADHLLWSSPLMGVTIPSIMLLEGLPTLMPPMLSPLGEVAAWALQDLQPNWVQRMLRLRQLRPAHKRVRRLALKAAINAPHVGTGGIREARRSRQRAAAETEPATASEAVGVSA